MPEALFTTIGDEPVEARIVAWVLGEASAFEAAELERLCEEKPELMVFKRRMLALHGLLAEAENSQADDAWKLSPDKRKPVEEIFGEGAQVRLEVVKEKRIGRSARRAFLAIAACVLITLFITRLQPWKQTSEAIIEVKSRTAGMSPLGGHMSESSGVGRMTPQFFGTESEKIESRKSLERVVDNLDLTDRWGVDKEEAVAKLKKSIKTEKVDGTDMLKIQVRRTDKKEADEITREVAYAYKDYREQIEKQDAERQLAELDRAIQDQEDKVEERRKVLSVIDQTIQARASGGVSQSDIREEAIKRGLDTQDLVDAKREFESDQQLLQTMKLKQMGEAIASKAPSESVVLHEIPEVEAKPARVGSEALASNTPARTQRLETTLPKELIEGTPRPMNVPNLETPASGPAGSGSWRSRGTETSEPFGEMSALSSLGESKPASPPMPSAQTSPRRVFAEGASPSLTIPEPTDSFTAMNGVFDGDRKVPQGGLGGGAADRDSRPRVVPPAPPAESASALALGDSRDFGQGSGGGGGFGGAVPSAGKPETTTIAGISNNSGSIEVESASLAGEKAQQEGKPPVAGDMPVLGHLFSNDESDNLSGESRIAQNDDMTLNSTRSGTSSYNLSGTNTYYRGTNNRGTIVSGVALSLDATGNVSGTAPAPATEPMPDQSVPTDANGPVGTVAAQPRPASSVITEEVRYKIDESDKLLAQGASDADYFDTSKAAAKGKASGTEREIQTGHNSEYLFRGADLGRDHDNGADKEKNEQDLQLPRITTRSALAPEAALKAAEELRNTGKTDEAKKMLEDTLSENSANKQVRDEIAKLDDPIRSNAALTHDHTRSQLLSEAEKSWETEVPAQQAKVDVIREFQYPTEYEPPASPNADVKAVEFPKTPASPASWMTQDESTKTEAKDTLAKAIRDQENKVEERRKVLATIVRTKGIIYKGSDESEKEAIKRGLDAQDYVDAKREFEKDQEILQQMKLKLMAATMKAKPEPPKPDLAKLMEEISTSEEPYSTFSLNISDASFRIAQAAIAKGERPDPAGVKVEQFYNAVDYGDPSPAAGEPVSCAIEQAAHPVIPGRNLVRVALKTAAAGRAATQPLHLTLLVDQSGSMTRADRRAAMDAAMAGLGKLLTEKDVVNIVGFSRNSRLVADGMKGDAAGKKLAELVNQSASEGGTNLETAINLAGQMAQRRMPEGAQNRIVLLTDGAANLGDADPQRLAAKVEQLRQQGVAFDIAGIAADGLNDELLGELARKGNGRYYVVGKGEEEDFAKQLAGAFRPAAENVKVQVRFNPERVARYKLIGFEKDRLKTEDFRNDKVDAAELAAEEAGVAIYQIEPNPNGSGEIGEVSVRFRDTASGEMVERGWTIPNDANAPAIDRATPSMQLATLAMFAAEKLKGGPLGEAIDFKQLAEPAASAKQFYGSNARVGEMLRMVDALK